MKKVLAFLLAACMIMPLAACGNAASSNSTAGESGNNGGGNSSDKIIIGGIAPLTGGAAQYGNAVNNGVLLAVKEINEAGGILGKQIEYIVEDDKGDATESLNAYNKLMNDGMVALVGAVTSKPTIAVAQKAAQDNLPMITASATAAAVTEQGENVFRTCFIDPFQGQLMANYAFERLGAKTAAVMYDNTDDYSQGVAEAFKEEAEKLGITITAYESFVSSADDFNAQLTKIKEGNPDVIMAPSYYEAAAKIITQARNLGIESKMIGPDGWDGLLEQVKENQEVLNDSFYCSQYSAESENPDLQAFIKNYRETYKINENMFAVLGYDSMKIMAAAIEAAGSTDSDAVIKALAATNHVGLTGTTTFDENRNPVREAFIIELVDGKAVVKEAYNFK